MNCRWNCKCNWIGQLIFFFFYLFPSIELIWPQLNSSPPLPSFGTNGNLSILSSFRYPIEWAIWHYIPFFNKALLISLSKGDAHAAKGFWLIIPNAICDIGFDEDGLISRIMATGLNWIVSFQPVTSLDWVFYH